jgi:hypothetical protein
VESSGFAYLCPEVIGAASGFGRGTTKRFCSAGKEAKNLTASSGSQRWREQPSCGSQPSVDPTLAQSRLDIVAPGPVPADRTAPPTAKQPPPVPPTAKQPPPLSPPLAPPTAKQPPPVPPPVAPPAPPLSPPVAPPAPPVPPPQDPPLAPPAQPQPQPQPQLPVIQPAGTTTGQSQVTCAAAAAADAASADDIARAQMEAKMIRSAEMAEMERQAQEAAGSGSSGSMNIVRQAGLHLVASAEGPLAQSISGGGASLATALKRLTGGSQPSSLL